MHPKHSTTQIFRAAILALSLGVSVVTPLKAQETATDWTPSKEFKAECEARLPPTQVSVMLTSSGLTYDFDTSVSQLTKISNRTKKSNNQFVLGLAIAEYGPNVRLSGASIIEKGTKSFGCFRPVVEVKFKLDAQKIYVAKEFPQGTCAFNEIFQHEMRHVQVHHKYADFVASALNRELKSQFGNQIYYGNVRNISKALGKNINDEWIPWAVSLFEKNKAEQMLIDSPEEYERSKTFCEGIVVKTLSSRQRRNP